MKIIVQRVSQAQVEVEGQVVGKIDKGYLLYVCLMNGDNQQSIERAVDKILQLRINEDENRKMNLNIQQVGGAILSVSQFTLSWDGKKGHRPSFENSMQPAQAKLLFHLFNSQLKQVGLVVEQGVFAADMKVTSTNDGPVTFILDF